MFHFDILHERGSCAPRDYGKMDDSAHSTLHHMYLYKQRESLCQPAACVVRSYSVFSMIQKRLLSAALLLDSFVFVLCFDFIWSFVLLMHYTSTRRKIRFVSGDSDNRELWLAVSLYYCYKWKDKDLNISRAVFYSHLSCVSRIFCLGVRRTW